MNTGIAALKLFLLLSTTVGIVAAKSCTSSRDCDHEGFEANCCNGTCHDSWSIACEKGGCAAGETFVRLRYTSSSIRCCLNNTDPCSTPELCQVKNACRNVPGTQTAQFTCASCPAGMHGNWCDGCSTSEVCNYDTRTNCCNGTCQSSWSNACKNAGCAAGETYVKLPITSYSNRRCLNSTNPCSTPQLCQVKKACRKVPGTQTAQFTCASCPAGMHGNWCERCSSSDACRSGTAVNCCNGTCDASSGSGCASGKACAKGETWVPMSKDSRNYRWCLNTTDPCRGVPFICAIPLACRSDKTDNGEYHCATCPTGLYGAKCTDCTTSDACPENCCSGKCHYNGSPVCASGKNCAQGEHWNPNATGRKCVKNSLQ